MAALIVASTSSGVAFTSSPEMKSSMYPSFMVELAASLCVKADYGGEYYRIIRYAYSACQICRSNRSE